MPHVDDEYMNLKAPQHRGPPPPPSAHRETSPSRALPHSRKGKATTEPTSVSAYGFPPEQYPPHHPAAAGHLYPPYHHPFGAPRPHASAFNDLTHATNVHMPHPPPPPSSSPHIPPPRYEQYPYEGGHFPHPYPPMPHPLEQGAGGGGYSYYHHHPDARPLLPPMHHHQHPSSSSMGPPPPRFHPYTEVPPPYHHGEQQQHYTHFLPPSAAISSSPSNKSSGSSVASLTPRGSMDGSEYSPDGQYQGGEQVNEVGPNDVLCGR